MLFFMYLRKFMIKTIIALGNGLEYSNTPHNRGEDFMRWYLKENNILLKQEKLYDYAVIENGNTVVIPKTFMNQSGKVLPLLKNKNLFTDHRDLLIIVDDIQKKIGEYPLRKEPIGVRGHNGLRSIQEELKKLKINNLPPILSIGIMPHNVEKTPEFVTQYVLRKDSKSDIEYNVNTVFPLIGNYLKNEKIL